MFHTPTHRLSAPGWQEIACSVPLPAPSCIDFTMPDSFDPAMRKTTAFTLIELLIVIAIIGILMSLLFPAVNSAINTARKAQAKNDVTQIASAIVAYEAEYGKLPGLAGSSSDTTISDNKDIIATLTGTQTNENARAITFIEVGAWKKGKGGTNSTGNFVDPWGNVYKIVLDGDSDNSISVKSGLETTAGATNEILRKKVAVFNLDDSSKESSATNYFRYVVKSW